jgi:hypothetical protein
MRNFFLRTSLCLVLIGPSWLLAQTPTQTSVVGPRPVMDVILQWERQYGWVVTYEDPRFEYAGDLEDVTTKVRKDLKPGEPIEPDKRIVGARERQLSVTYTPPQTPRNTTASYKAVSLLASAYAKGTGNTFEIRQSDTRIHLLPGMARDALGDLKPSRPVMDTIITIPAQDRSGIEFMHAFCDTLSSDAGHKIFVGMMPSNSLAQFRTKGGYENLSAREILEKFLNQMPKGDRYTWALLFQKDYALNIHYVADLNRSLAVPPVVPHDTARRKVVVKQQPDGTVTVDR